MLKQKLSLRASTSSAKEDDDQEINGVTYATLYSKDLIKKNYELTNEKEKENYELRPERLLALTSSTLHSLTHE